MKFSDILGNEGVKQRLRQMVASDKIPHALLFEGPEGIGKLAMARAFAQYVHCQHPTADGEPCGECPSCLQYQTFNQPDTFFVFPIYKRKSGRDSYCDEFIEEWNEKLDAFAAENLDSPWFGALALIVLFAFGCWGVSYFSKK